jgi:hypothetical protein
MNNNNLQVLTVGPPAGKGAPASYHGFPIDFTSIREAMDAIPLMQPDDPFVRRWTIFVTAGYYEEEIRMKPHVNIVGIDKDSVYIQPPAERPQDRNDPRRANVYLNYFTSISNVILANRGDSLETDYVIWNKNTYGGVHRPASSPDLDVSFIGLTNVDIMPFGPYPDSADSLHGYALGKAILFEGNWHTAIVSHVFSGYLAQNGYLVNVKGIGQNADCHFIDCFFDGLYITSEYGGCVHVGDCYEVHIRNSLIRTAAGGRLGLKVNQQAPGAAVATYTSDHKAWVTLEGTSLEAPWPGGSYRVLDVRNGTGCDFYHSSTDSVRGRANVFERSLADKDTVRL